MVEKKSEDDDDDDESDEEVEEEGDEKRRKDDRGTILKADVGEEANGIANNVLGSRLVGIEAIGDGAIWTEGRYDIAIVHCRTRAIRDEEEYGGDEIGMKRREGEGPARLASPRLWRARVRTDGSVACKNTINAYHH